MAMGKTNKGSMNHYQRFAGKALHQYATNPKKLDKLIDAYAERIAERVLKKLFKRWGVPK